jgi:hypothetical protein
MIRKLITLMLVAAILSLSLAAPVYAGRGGEHRTSPCGGVGRLSMASGLSPAPSGILRRALHFVG